MKKLPLVEEARAIMTEGMEWSVWRWLMEKKRVRIAADKATESLDELDKQTKETWPDSLRKAYREAELLGALDGNPKVKKAYEKAREDAQDIDPKIKVEATKVREADDIAYDARMTAEETFAEAERLLSPKLCRQGAQQAIEAYDLREKAIRRSEAARRAASE